ncbi:phosphonate C-P lyase system protein PhnH [Motilimonas sp. KMU-193]|uniref:phosphonate C-P lyase system protein PhnH n=1 Tax=Motilimonas sp. KMU-193 TaxID=3388668 RepID=UPI00396B4188
MSIIAPGFSQPVENSQACFRQLLSAMSEPGREVKLDKHAGFRPLSAAASQIILCLCDQQTPLYLSPYLENFAVDSDITQAQRNFTFHCNTKPSSLINAHFAVVASQESINFAKLNAGSDEQPEHSTTLVIESTSFNQGPAFTLSGPGIAQPRTVQLGELHPKIIHYLTQPSHAYPLGIDMLFCCEQSVIAISRTTKVELAPCM